MERSSKKMIYLASPYSHISPSVRRERYDEICQVARSLTSKYIVYSPIMHWHPVTVKYGMPTDALSWKSQNEGMLILSNRLVICKLDGWE